MNGNSRLLRQLCPVCAAETDHRGLLKGVSPEQGLIARCLGCGLTRLLPPPLDDAHAAATRGMYAERTVFDPQKAAWAERSVAAYLDTLTSLGHARPARMLDLGGGLGYYSRAFAARGIEVAYFDLDPVSIQFAAPLNQAAGVRVIEDLDVVASGRPVDLVFCRHVVEHIPRPDAVLARVARLTARGGALIIETDNGRSLEHLLHPSAGLYWRAIYRDCYREGSLLRLAALRPLAIAAQETHYWAFSAATLERLLARAGWTPRLAFDYGFGDPVYWPNVPRPSDLALWLPFRGARHALRALAYSLARPALKSAGALAGLCVYARRAGRDASEA
jgi:2-polyprenyl-3-methyl-5-hydroxy-6-metoxy-1,4-benzoquinol methylase